MSWHDSGITIQTNRLILRPWRDGDLKPFAAMNADPEVMRYYPATLTRQQSDEFAAFIRNLFAPNGRGLFAVELPPYAGFIGYIGLLRVPHSLPFAPATEIGWRLARRWWNAGLATEGASAVLQHAFNEWGFDEIVSMTSVVNTPSRRVMEKIGLQHSPDEDFDHPKVPAGHELARHVLYRRRRDA